MSGSAGRTEVHLGIDLAAQPRDTGLCELRWDGDAWVATFPSSVGTPMTDDELLGRISDVDGRVGVDVPFGWPSDFVEAVSAHHREHTWPDPGLDPQRQVRRLRYRLTDLWVSDRLASLEGERVAWRLPLSVSTDLLGVPAFRMARLERRLRDRGVAVDRSGRTGRLVEVYPAGALRVWGIHPTVSYKRDPDARRGVVEALERLLDGAVRGDWQRVCREDDDQLDALVCALVARLADEGRTVGANRVLDGTDLATVADEGWIHLPADSAW